MLDMLLSGFAIVFSPQMFLMIIFGVFLGTVFGALPGISNTMAVALGIPFTYTMTPVQSIVFLTTIFCASVTGGGMTAILFKIPGVPSSAPTTYDGYPMAQQGKAGKALGIQLTVSAVGGIVAALVMLFLCGPLTAAAVSFGQAELFAIAFLGLSILTSLDADNICRTIISGLIGLLLASIGLDPLLGIPRMTFGIRELNGGVEMVPIMIGFFAVTEVLKQTVKHSEIKGVDQAKKIKTDLPSIAEMLALKWTILRNSILGCFIGVLPGAGATIAAFLGYSVEQKSSKHPEKFGTGCPEGIAAPEVANSAAAGCSLVPLLSLGIPGGPATAVMMSALVLKGVQMGPMLLIRQPEYLSSIFVSMLITSIVMVVAAMLIAKVFAQILKIPYSSLGPLIIMISTIGAFATKNISIDVTTMVVAGLIGFVFVSCKFNISAMILGLVLGKICESNLRRAYIVAPGTNLWDTTWNVFTQPLKIAPIPLTGILMLVCIFMLAYPAIKPLIVKALKNRNKAD
jgi:putative tricarboxylic transport membrane protein